MIKMKEILCFVALLCLLEKTHAAASYARKMCEREPIHTTRGRTPGDNGFRIIVNGNPGSNKYRPGETYTVEINGTDDTQKFIGFMLVAVPQKEKKMSKKLDISEMISDQAPEIKEIKADSEKPSTESETVGTFDTEIDVRVQNLLDDEICDHAVLSHRYLVPKNNVKMLWKAPEKGVGCIEFKATVIDSLKWYKDDGQLTYELCEEKSQQDDAQTANVDDQGDQVPNQDDDNECCACGHANYNIVFQGVWSRQTHPKGFPPKKFNPLVHWSNVVGATHSSDFEIWKYGGMASPAVKEVCEFGIWRTLEKYMKEQSRKIRTVVKTKSLYGVRNIKKSAHAVFTVSKKQHLLSLLTMFGPSPDWCVGVSALDICNKNCTWADHMEIDLYPWDAGTDSGTSYMSANKATIPREPISRITNKHPRTHDSPFFGHQPIKPLARLIITKDKEWCSGDDGTPSSAELSPSTDELVSAMKKKMMMKKKLELEKCSTSQWSDWNDCSNPCGAGMRLRQRMLKNPAVTESMCNVDLMEKETCIGDCSDRVGQRKKISDNFEFRVDTDYNPDDICAVTPWSDWSPCSATCGLGMKERWRMFLSKSEKTLSCGFHLMEKDLCRGEIFDCRKALMMKDFSAICTEPAEVGPCRGDFERWYYNKTVEKCQSFRYGGCRGNDNRFDSEDECVQHCQTHMANMKRKQQMMRKQQMEELQESNDMSIKELMRKKQMMEEALQQAADTTATDKAIKALMRKKQMLEQALGKGSVDSAQIEIQIEDLLRKKQMMEDAIKYGLEDDTQTMSKSEMRKKKKMMRKKMKMEKRRLRRLRARPNKNGPQTDCMVTPWSDWGDCSVTCGRGYMMKTRMIKQESQNGGRKCPKKLVKKRKCKLRKCPIDCEMGEWSEWSECSNSCGDSAVQVRKRKIKQRPKRGGQPCLPKREKRFCSLSMCPDADMEKDMKTFMLFHRRF